MANEEPIVGFKLSDLQAWVNRSLWILLAVSLAGHGVRFYFDYVKNKKIAEAELRAKESERRAETALADADRWRTSKAPIIVKIQTNLVVVAQGQSNLARAESDYSGASALDALAVYERRHPLLPDDK